MYQVGYADIVISNHLAKYLVGSLGSALAAVGFLYAAYVSL